MAGVECSEEQIVTESGERVGSAHDVDPPRRPSHPTAIRLVRLQRLERRAGLLRDDVLRKKTIASPFTRRPAQLVILESGLLTLAKSAANHFWSARLAWAPASELAGGRVSEPSHECRWHRCREGSGPL